MWSPSPNGFVHRSCPFFILFYLSTTSLRKHMFGSQQGSAGAVFFSYVSCFGRIVRCERSRQPLQPLALSSARVRPAPLVDEVVDNHYDGVRSGTTTTHHPHPRTPLAPGLNRAGHPPADRPAGAPADDFAAHHRHTYTTTAPRWSGGGHCHTGVRADGAAWHWCYQWRGQRLLPSRDSSTDTFSCVCRCWCQ